MQARSDRCPHAVDPLIRGRFCGEWAEQRPTDGPLGPLSVGQAPETTRVKERLGTRTTAGSGRLSRSRAVVPRCTQDSDALALVREHWPAFRDRLEERAGSLPAFVTGELDALLTCGDFEHGFLVAECQRCGDSLRVPFACKSRGVCPSCMGRRMAETAALLVEHRLPAVPWRQWVLSFPGPLAVRLGYDRALLGSVCQRFGARVMQRRLTKHAHGLTSSAALHPGVLIVVQRFRNDLGLFVHLHALATDGCFDASDEQEPRFLPIVGQLTDEHLLHTLQRMHADFAALEGDHDDDVTPNGTTGRPCSA